MLVTGNTKVSDLLCVTPPRIPEGADAMTQLIELPPADAGLGPPGVDMITMLEPEEIAARDHLRHPSARQHQD